MNQKQMSTPEVSAAGLPKGRRFSDEFKHDAVRLVTDEQYSFKAAATAVGVCQKTVILAGQ